MCRRPEYSAAAYSFFVPFEDSFPYYNTDVRGLSRLRMRKKKNLDVRFAACADVMAFEPKEKRGKWRALFGNDNPIHLEIGCGKGKFSVGMAQLLARVENILRRTKKERTRFVFDALTVDLPSRRVTKDGREVALTALEFDLLAMLVRRNNVALSREALLAGVWGYAYQGETRTVDVHIQRLRGKIGAEYIETVYKYGYRFCGKEVERR